MNKKELEAFAREAAKSIKTESDLNDFRQMLTKVTVETALNAELDEHLGYGKHEKSPAGNSRNGYSSMTLKTEDGEFELSTPRDREGSFEPQLVKKQQTRFTSMDDKILSLYAKGMTTREIVATFKEMYDADVSASLISKVTDAVIEQVVEWQSRPLDAVYPIVYLDCIVVKIRQDRQVINKSVYLALGVNIEGHKELLGMWLSENEGAKFWLNVLTELQNRGVKVSLVDSSSHVDTADPVEYESAILLIRSRMRTDLDISILLDAITSGDIRSLYVKADRLFRGLYLNINDFERFLPILKKARKENRNYFTVLELSADSGEKQEVLYGLIREKLLPVVTYREGSRKVSAIRKKDWSAFLKTNVCLSDVAKDLSVHHLEKY